jgi:uncharacterized membrane protein
MSDLTRVTQTALKSASKGASKATSKDGALSDPKTLAVAGVGLAALPLAVEQIAKRVAPKVSDLGEQAKGKVSDVASGAASDLGDQAKQAAKGAVLSKLTPGSGEGEGEGLLSKLTPGSGEGEGGGLLSKLKPGSSNEEDGDDQGRAAPGQGGSGRRMPIQQSVDVAVPIKVAYNRWTQFEDWPEFMHRFEGVDQSDDTTLSFTVKMWGLTRRFQAEIVEQRPDERIEWNVTEGPSHTGVVTFHELAPRLTRVEVSLDFDPHGMLEKMARGMRFTKRAVRGDLHRFKAMVELDEEAEDGFRGTIEDGKVKTRTERRSSGSRSRSRSQSGNGSRSRGRGQSKNGSRASSSTRKTRNSRSRSSSKS